MVIFKYNRDGTVETKAMGYAGEGCRKVTAALTKDMGKVSSDVPTEEALLPERSPAEVQQQQIRQ
jgi:Protein of unknown function (DUF2997)